jgi:hypothetical protein
MFIEIFVLKISCTNFLFIFHIDMKPHDKKKQVTTQKK